MYPLPDGMFAPRNQWHVAGLSSEVGPVLGYHGRCDRDLKITFAFPGSHYFFDSYARASGEPGGGEHVGAIMGPLPAEILLNADTTCGLGRRMFAQAIGKEMAG